MRMMGIAAAVCALAACGQAEQAEAPAAGAAVDSAAEASGGAAAEGVQDTAFTFRTVPEGPGTVDSILVLLGGRAVQTLRPSENGLPSHSDVERVSRVDLDFDGHADLGFVTELSMAGSRSEYWRLDPGTGRFQPAGVYETLQPDSAARELTTYVRGGHAGRLWTASRWRWMGGALVEVRREEQDVLPDGDGYVRIVWERRNGEMAETSRDTLDDASPHAGPSWAEP